MPARRAWLLAGGGVLALAVATAIAVTVALAGLHQLRAGFDIGVLPSWLWYYRGDPLLRTWLLRGYSVAGLVVGLSAVAILRQRQPLHGAARFARENEIAGEGLRAERGIILGRKSGRFLIFGGSEHVLLEAPTRSGKGVGLVIPNLLNWPDSAVVLDVKRENWTLTAGFRKAGGQEVWLFDPLTTDGRTARYNPLSYIDRTDQVAVIDELQKIAVMLFPNPERGDPFWAESARTGFIGVGAYVAAMPHRPFTIGEIYRTMTQGDPKTTLPKLVEDAAAEGIRISAPCLSAIVDFTGGSENTFAGVRQTITSKLSLWLNPYVDAATAESDFDLRELRRRHISLYLGVSPDNMERVAPVYNLLLQQLVDLNTRTLPEMDGTLKFQVLVILDEFVQLGRAMTIANSFSYIAGYGLRLMPVIQGRSQLRALYGDQVARSIITNCGVEVAFTPKELDVAKELSERLGFYGAKAESKSLSSRGVSANRSKTESEQRRALMMPQELMQMSRHDMLVLRGGIPPIRAKKLYYYKMRAFTQRVQRPPEIEAHPLKPEAIPPAPVAARPGPPLANIPDMSQPVSSGAETANIVAPIEDSPPVDREMTAEEIAGTVAIPADALMLDDIEVPRAGANEGEARDFVEQMLARAIDQREPA